jgi:peptidoglycan lytic transglycosylase
LLVLGACAHESTLPQASVGGRARPNSPPGPSYPPAAAATYDDQALATQFRAAPALATLQGEASYYSDGLAGHPTASGELYRPLGLTAAHRRLPLGTVLRITSRDGGRVVYVRVNDRGPYGSKRRILDLSRAAAEQLGMLRAGVLQVRAEVVAYGPKKGR